MRKNITNLIVLTLIATLVLSVPVIYAGSKNANGENGNQGTNKESNQLPDESNVPPPAGLVEDIFGDTGEPHVVEGCRAEGGDVLVHVGGILGDVLGGACCASNIIDEDSGNPYPNECCNPPDILYDPEDYTPGNHCLCFVMRFELPPP
ncbi:MAG: hypothetical protein ACXABF_11990 [Candidatus Thorarchaeota archaeon]|jgi:hypothetical protein